MNSTSSKKSGYPQKNLGQDVKRYCQTLDLKDDPDLIQEYIKRHGELNCWPEILQGIRSVGILEMEIYQIGTRLFMIVETHNDFEWDSAFEKLSKLPRQSEWEEYMSIFQQADPQATSSEKWKLMDRIFHIYDSALNPIFSIK